MVRVQLRISGRVQGVGFRWAAQETADRLGLVGWVRNAEDGAVESVAEGDQQAIDSFVLWCRRGPRGARVDEVREQHRPATGEFTSFRITS
jgi:acylphosphatase